MFAGIRLTLLRDTVPDMQVEMESPFLSSIVPVMLVIIWLPNPVILFLQCILEYSTVVLNQEGTGLYL